MSRSRNTVHEMRFWDRAYLVALHSMIAKGAPYGDALGKAEEIAERALAASSRRWAEGMEEVK